MRLCSFARCSSTVGSARPVILANRRWPLFMCCCRSYFSFVRRYSNYRSRSNAYDLWMDIAALAVEALEREGDDPASGTTGGQCNRIDSDEKACQKHRKGHKELHD